MNINCARGILFDSRRTLNVPRTGHWFITPNFKSIIENAQFVYTCEQLSKATEKTYEFINDIKLIESEEHKFLMFKDFYEIDLIYFSKEIKSG